MNNKVWLNTRVPQTLYIAQVMLYISAAFALLFGAGSNIIENGLLRIVVALLLTFGAAGGAFGIANERRWGYQLGVAAAVAPFVVRLEIWRRLDLGTAIEWNFLGLVFDIAILAALLHQQSAQHQRIYFR